MCVLTYNQPSCLQLVTKTMTPIAKSSSPRTPNGSRTKWTSNCSRLRPRTIWTSTKCSTWSPKRCWWTNCSNWCKTTSKRAAILCFIRRGTARRRTSAVELAESRSNLRLFSFVYWVGVCDDDECSMRVSGCCVFYFDRHGRYTVVVANIYIFKCEQTKQITGLLCSDHDFISSTEYAVAEQTFVNNLFVYL